MNCLLKAIFFFLIFSFWGSSRLSAADVDSQPLILMGKFDQSGYGGMLFQHAHGKDGFTITIGMTKFPQKEDIMNLANEITIWILLPQGKTAHLRSVDLKEANDTPSLIYFFDRFSAPDSTTLVIQVDREYQFIPFVPAFTIDK